MSDPSAIQVPVQTAVTSDMALGLKPACPKSRVYRQNISPNNKQIFTANDVIYIDIPTGRPGTWFDPSQSYLKFSVQCATTTACNTATNIDGVFVDNSAYSFLQRLDVYCGSNQIETISGYGALCNQMLDIQLSANDKAGLSTMIGTNPYTTIVNTGATYAQYSEPITVQYPGDRSGLGLTTTTSLSSAIPYTFCLPLLSGTVGVSASKYIPVSLLKSPINLQIYTSANDDAIKYDTAGAGATWQIINVEFVATFIEIDSPQYAMEIQEGVPIYISTKSWRQSGFTVTANSTGEITNLLSFRMASLCSLLGRFRNFSSAVQGANASSAYRLSSSVNPNISSYYFKLGSQVIPNKPVYLYNGSLVGNGSEGFAELQKSVHALSATVGNSAFNSNCYNVAVSANGQWSTFFGPGTASGIKARGVVDSCQNAFAIGQEFETFNHKSDVILSGISTLNTNLFFTMSIISGATTGASNIVADFYANYDVILIIQDGQMMAKF
jgi:hypothetical protein